MRLPTWVGDVLMATPVLRALRARYPAAELILEGRPSLLQLLEGLPTFDRFVADPGRGIGALARRVQALRALDCDCAVLLPDSVRAALAPALARIPLRVGYARDAARRVLLTRALTPPMRDGRRVAISMVERYLRIARALDCVDPAPGLDIALSPAASAVVTRRLGALGIAPDARLVVLTPGAAFGSSKLWPPASFARAATELRARHGLTPVIAPGPGEESIAHEIARQSDGTLVLAEPPTTLGELAALIARASLLITNDTGPRHMAVACGTPVVALLGPTDPGHTSHLLERQQVLREDVDCSPCHKKQCPIDHRCMVRLAPARVVAASAVLLADADVAGGCAGDAK